MTEKCSYEDCEKESVTELEINDNSRPVCHGHITDMVQEHTEDQEDEDSGRYPVMTNSDDQAAWINTDKNGNTYLSIKISDGNYLNLFPQNDHLQIALNQIHEVQKQQ